MAATQRTSGPTRRKRILVGTGAALVVLTMALVMLRDRFLGPMRPVVASILARRSRIDTPSPLAAWPWPQAKRDGPHAGVTHWVASSADHTIVDLFDFDFGANPNLRFEIFDQDEADAKPFDNRVDFWDLGVGQATHLLNTKFQAAGQGKVVAAWNGLCFGYHRHERPISAFHVAPVVLRGKVYYPQQNHRWTFGVKYKDGHPAFKVFHMPDTATLAKEFDYAAGSAQCLIKEGKPLELQPFPPPYATPLPQPRPSTPDEAGHIPDFDHMKSCRASLGWTNDSRHLYLLFVKEPDTEAGSIEALHRNVDMGGGWMVSDLQHFWQSFGVPNAINSDAGDAAQLTYARPDGNYELIPERMASNAMRLTFGPDFKNAPTGGTIMYLYIRDTKG